MLLTACLPNSSGQSSSTSTQNVASSFSSVTSLRNNRMFDPKMSRLTTIKRLARNQRTTYPKYGRIHGHVNGISIYYQHHRLSLGTCEPIIEKLKVCCWPTITTDSRATKGEGAVVNEMFVRYVSVVIHRNKSAVVLQLKTFHKIDRELYVRLVISMNREPMQSLKIMSLWLWLQQMGFPNIIQKTLSLTDEVVHVVADEAVHCINSLDLFVLPISTDINIPMTQNLMERPISIYNIIHHNRGFAIAGIEKIINEVFLRVFNDIIEEARAKAANESVPVGNVSGGSDHDQQGIGARVGNRTVSQHPSTGLSPPARRLN